MSQSDKALKQWGIVLQQTQWYAICLMIVVVIMELLSITSKENREGQMRVNKVFGSVLLGLVFGFGITVSAQETKKGGTD
ncbi:MAG: hypothetical protein IPL01_17955 [Acidobacteria bacterium]|nr:hypothetical protein [Acidobacteriota bacterium]